MAAALIRAFESADVPVHLASELRLYDRNGDQAKQGELAVAARAEVDHLLADPKAAQWQAWVTYHNYYKAPDLVGPAVSRALGIPYLQVESTRARKRLVGPWANFAEAAESASDAAHTIFYFTHRDAETLRRDAPEGQRLVHLPPFLARTDLPDISCQDGAMLSVGMMRHGDKLASYQLVADTLALLPSSLEWSLCIAGDGEARAEVERMMAPHRDRVTFLGALGPDDLATIYARSGLFFWPGVNEAFGLVYLEAQGAGLPVVAQDRPGVRDVLYGKHPRPKDGPEAMAHQVVTLLSDAPLRKEQGRKARALVEANHLLNAAAATLSKALKEACA